MTDANELGRLLARFTRTGCLPPDRDAAVGALKPARVILERKADDGSRAHRELREMLAKRVFGRAG